MRRAVGRCRGSAPGPLHRTPGHRADTRRQRRGGGGGDSATSGIPGTRTTNGIIKTQVKDVLPAMQPLDSTLWWLMLARSPGRGDQTDRRAQRSTVWCPRPRAAHPLQRVGPHQSRLQAGCGATWHRGHRQRGAHPEGANLAARPGTAAGVREEVSARLKDCLVPRRQRQGGPESRFLACQLQALLGGKEAGGGREACSPFEGRVGS